VHDRIGLRDHLDVAIGLDLDELARRVEDDLVLLRPVDDRDPLATFAVVEDDPVTGARLDQLGVVLAGLVDLDRLLLPAPQRADDDRPIDVAMLEDHEHLIVDLGEHVGASIGAGHRHCDPRPEGRVLLVEPWKLDLDAIAGIAIAVLVVDDDRRSHASQPGRAPRPRRDVVDHKAHGSPAIDT
jgi:hypothetical protein